MRSKLASRAQLIFLGFIVLFLVLAVRLVSLQMFSPGLLEKLSNQHQSAKTLKPVRGSIFDREGRLLAMSIDVYTLKCVPHEVEDKGAIAEAFQEILGLDPEYTYSRLNSSQRVVYIKRKIKNEAYEKIQARQLPGIYFDKESRRLYPKDKLACHVVGMVNIDGVGTAGIEQSFHKALRGQAGHRKVLRDGRLRELPARQMNGLRKIDGYDLYLTLDTKIQHIVEKEIAKLDAEHHPKAITAIVVNAKTGEILALANTPDYNPNRAADVSAKSWKNWSISDMIEPGSTFKIVPFSAVLNEKVAATEDVIYCEQGAFKVKGRRRRLHDHRPHGDLTVAQVLQKSSNIGTVKLGMKLGKEKLYAYIRRFGFGQRTRIGLPAESPGGLRSLDNWQEASMSSVPMGQEIGTTPLQMVMAMAVIANKGILMKPLIVKKLKDKEQRIVQRFLPEPVRRVIREDVAQTMITLLEGVVNSDGTARRAGIEGVRVAGKTGTAQKFDKETKRYSDRKYVGSFIGFLPDLEEPLVIGVFVDEPPYSKRYGGLIAAPVFKSIAENIIGSVKS